MLAFKRSLRKTVSTTVYFFGTNGMNWLAHIFISKNSIDYQLGNLLADPLKGKCWEGASHQFKDGIKMHRKIDSFTDSNKLVSKSKSRLKRKGHLKGVVVDIVYDYFLLSNWNQYSKVNLETFIDSFYRDAGRAIEKYPCQAKEFVERLINSGNLISNGSVSDLELALLRVDRRLSKRILVRESTIEYLSALKKEIVGLEEDFSQFFPQLIEYFKSMVEIPVQEHWLR